MRQLKFMIVGLVAMAAASAAPTASADAFRSAWTKLAMPFRMARLSMAEPDAALLFPVQGGAVARVADTWGAPRPLGRLHEGQDLFAPRGTPVLSATRGIVIRISEAGLGGNSVSVLGPGGRTYYYAHLESHAKGLAVGQPVTTATALGYVGNTGNARTTPPHLHFGAYGASGAIDPLPLLADRQKP